MTSTNTSTSTGRAGAMSRRLATAAAQLPRSHHSRHTHQRLYPLRESDLYTGAELSPRADRPGATDALALPSRMGRHLHYRDGSIGSVEAHGTTANTQ